MAELISREPATGAELWRGTTSDVDLEVMTARTGFAPWASRSLAYRIETLRRFANVVRSRREAMADLVARETGKPLWEARAEVDAVIARVDSAVGACTDRTAQRRLDSPMGSRMALRHKPHGAVAVLTPFNAPVELAADQIVPALIAGNAVIFKPSEKTPASGIMLVECLHAAGVPEETLRIVIGGADEGQALARHECVDGLFFTGSAHVGIALNRLFADQPEKMLALEMGGNNPILVWDTPDLHTAAVLVVQSAFASAGQHCAAARRLIVQESLADALLEQVSALAGRLLVGAPHDNPQPYAGPVISSDAADGLTESFLALMMKGGRPVRHLGRPDPARPFLTPGIIDVTDVPDRPDIELFGPLLQVIRTDDFDGAIAEANRTRYGLAASLISQTPALYDRFWARSRAGIVNWNRPTIGSPASAPRGGTGWSGNHRPGGYYAADHCAYPVVSNEADAARASIGIGLKDA